MYRRVFIGSALVSLFTSARALLGGNVSASTLPALTPPALAVTTPVVATFTTADKALLAKQMDAYLNGLQRYLTQASKVRNGVSNETTCFSRYSNWQPHSGCRPSPSYYGP